MKRIGVSFCCVLASILASNSAVAQFVVVPEGGIEEVIALPSTNAPNPNNTVGGGFVNGSMSGSTTGTPSVEGLTSNSKVEQGNPVQEGDSPFTSFQSVTASEGWLIKFSEEMLVVGGAFVQGSGFCKLEDAVGHASCSAHGTASVLYGGQ